MPLSLSTLRYVHPKEMTHHLLSPLSSPPSPFFPPFPFLSLHLKPNSSIFLCIMVWYESERWTDETATQPLPFLFFSPLGRRKPANNWGKEADGMENEDMQGKVDFPSSFPPPSPFLEDIAWKMFKKNYVGVMKSPSKNVLSRGDISPPLSPPPPPFLKDKGIMRSGNSIFFTWLLEWTTLVNRNLLFSPSPFFLPFLPSPEN